MGRGGVHSLFVSDDGAVYLCDYLQHTVRRWSPVDYVGTIVAGGNGSGASLKQLNEPAGIFVTSSGTLYIADKLNHRVVKWAAGASEGIIAVGGGIHGEPPNHFVS